MVYDLERYQWSDQQWMAERAEEAVAPERDQHLRSAPRLVAAQWRKRETAHLSYLEFAETLLPYVLEMGFTHIELLPDRRASFRRLVGLSGHELLRADQPLRDVRMSCGISSTPVIAPASA